MRAGPGVPLLSLFRNRLTILRMRLALAFWLLTFWISPIAVAQQPRPPAPKMATPRQAPSWPNVSKESQQRALKLLQQAEAGAASLDAASRIAALTDLARSYEKRDRAKAINLLETAFVGAQDLHSQQSDTGISMELSSLLRQFAKLAPERLDVRIFDVSPELRQFAVDLLIPYYVDHKRFDRAYELVTRVGQEGPMPFGAAITLMRNFGDRPEQLRSLFVTSLASYENDRSNQGFGGDDFAEMIVAFHDRVPDEAVIRAIDVVLSQAKESDNKNGRMDVSISSNKGAVHLGSAYEYRLFQLLPVLKQVDSSRAELLLKDNLDVATQLAKYPAGTKLFRSGDKSDSDTTMLMSVASPGAGDDSPSLIDRHRLATIEAEATKHPHDALANAELLSPPMAFKAYMAIARLNVANDAASARIALKKAQDSMDAIPQETRIIFVQRIAALYEQLEDKESARKSIEKGMEMAADVYRQETSGDNPNPAPIAFWLSTNAYRFLLSTALKVDSRWAESLLKDIHDDGILVFNEISMADALLGIPAEGYVAATDPKYGIIGYYPFGPRDGS